MKGFRVINSTLYMLNFCFNLCLFLPLSLCLLVWRSCVIYGARTKAPKDKSPEGQKPRDISKIFFTLYEIYRSYFPNQIRTK